MCVATLFITMKAHANANMNSTMVYRLLGLKKGVVIGIYSLEILLASIVVVFMVAFENVTQSTIMKNAYFITLSSIIVLISIFAL